MAVPFPALSISTILDKCQMKSCFKNMNILIKEITIYLFPVIFPRISRRSVLVFPCSLMKFRRRHKTRSFFRLPDQRTRSTQSLFTIHLNLTDNGINYFQTDCHPFEVGICCLVESNNTFCLEREVIESNLGPAKS